MLYYFNVLPDSPCLDDVERLYLSAFPDVERRTFDKVKTLLSKENVPFKIEAVYEDHSYFVGFLSYWDFGTFRYIEHFAVKETMRRCGMGGEILSNFVKSSEKQPIILEVEKPETKDARRRVDFYMRHSFIIWNRLVYIQPPYEQGYESLEMRLMTLGVNSQAKVEEMAKVIQKEVYKPISEY